MDCIGSLADGRRREVAFEMFDKGSEADML